MGSFLIRASPMHKVLTCILLPVCLYRGLDPTHDHQLQSANRTGLLQRYTAAFEEHGYENTSVLWDATDEQLDEVAAAAEMKMGHRNLFLRAAKKLRKAEFDRRA